MKDLYAVIGNPISHSLSPKIHHLFAEQTGQPIEYIKIKSPLDDFETTLNDFQQRGGKGCNITVPFKHQAAKLAQNLSEHSKLTSTVNTIIFNDNGSMFGDNTDGIGLVRDIQHNHNYQLSSRHILIIGAGGAAQSVIPNLMDENPASITIANRTPAKAIEIAKLFADMGPLHGCGLTEIPATPFDIIINATSATHKGETLNLPADIQLSNQSFCYDMTYGDINTAFLTWAHQIRSKDLAEGTGMLVEQAAESFYLWRQVRPDTQSVISAFSK